MIYVGIDLAAAEERTGLAVLREMQGRLILEELQVGAADVHVRRAIAASDKAGVDVPFGWPSPFVELLAAHGRGELAPPPSTDIDWRRTLALRATDLHVRDVTGLTPLSVSTDRIALPAMRWAGIEARLRVDGLDVARDGSGRVCEVYPAAAQRLWGSGHRGYKGARHRQVLAGMVDDLIERWPWLDLGGHHDLCERDDNAWDAVVAALVAREVHQGRAEAAPDHLRDRALCEGWVWLPTKEPAPPGKVRRR